MAKATETVPDSRGQKYSITEIRAKLREQLTSIHSIWCEYRVQWSADYKRDKPETWPTFIWAQQNSQILHRMLPQQPDSLKGGWWEEFISFDGQIGFQVLFELEQKSQQRQVQRTKAAPPTLSYKIAPASHLGLVVFGTSSNLLGLIEKAHVVVNPGPTIDGRPTVQIECEDYIPKHHLIVQLDPQFDFLPRRITSLPSRILKDQSQKGTSRSYTGQQGEAIWEIGVESFFEVDDPILGRKRWFPQRLLHTGEMTAFVEKVTLNQTIPLSAFQPPPSEDAAVFENVGTPQLRQTKAGATAKQSLAHADEPRSDQKPKSHSEKPIEANLTTSISLLQLLIFGSFLLITAACVCLRYRM